MTKPRLGLVATWESLDLDTDGEFLIPACEDAGFDVEVPVWRDANVDWSSFDLVVVRATWDYFSAPEEFLDWIHRVDAVTTLHNSAEVMAWNIDKRYLDELAEAGFPVVETSFVADADAVWSADLGRTVVKPTISAGSNDTTVYDSGDDPAVAAHVKRLVADGRVAMVQPYIEEIDTLGERGLVFYRGLLDHTFRKEPMLVGDREKTALFLREEISAATPTSEEVSLGLSIMDWLTNRFGGILYSRVDLVEQDGSPVVMEVELIEPGFFLNVDPPSAHRFAAVLAKLVGQ
ncbi:MAG: hypothetical protein R2706_01365 [Acidimicrobiales bacterium]